VSPPGRLPGMSGMRARSGGATRPRSPAYCTVFADASRSPFADASRSPMARDYGYHLPGYPAGIREATRAPIVRPVQSHLSLRLALYACRPLCRSACPGLGMRHAYKAVDHAGKRVAAAGKSGQAARRASGRRDPIIPEYPNAGLWHDFSSARTMRESAVAGACRSEPNYVIELTIGLVSEEG
jgi:hypothetical protein